MNRFKQLAENPEIALPQNASNINITQKARFVAVVAAGVFSLAGLIQNRNSFILLGVVCAVGALIFHGLNLRAQVIQQARKLAPLPNLDGIEEGLRALTDFKIDRCVAAFNEIEVPESEHNPLEVISTLLKSWENRFNNEAPRVEKIGELTPHDTYIVSEQSVLDYRRILPTARRFVALDLQTMPSLQHIQHAAFRFVNGYEKNPLNEEEKRDYINCTLEGNTIKAEPWNDSPDVF